MSGLPLDVTVWSKTFGRVDWVNDPDSVTASPAHLAVGSCAITFPLTHPKLPGLGADGARIKIDYLGETLMSGPIRSTSGNGGKFNGTITYTIEDDVRLFWRMLGIPKPSSPLSSQTVLSDIRTGPAETVVKGFASANAARLGIPLTVAPDLGRGATITGTLRMTPLSDILIPLLTDSGIGVTVVQSGAGFLLDVYETATYPQILTEDSGIVQGWSWSTQGPAATRTIIGDGGTGTARGFTSIVDAAMEAKYGDIVETFTDASGATTAADIAAAGQQTMTDGRPKAGLTVQLSENDDFKYLKTIRVGDKVPIQVGPGITITDVLTQAVITWDRDKGFNPVPVVGDRSDDPARTFVNSLARLARTVRRRGTA